MSPERIEALLPRFTARYLAGDAPKVVCRELHIGAATYCELRAEALARGLVAPRSMGRTADGHLPPFRADAHWHSGYRIAWEREPVCSACGQAIALQARVQWQWRRGKAARLVHVACAGVERSA